MTNVGNLITNSQQFDGVGNQTLSVDGVEASTLMTYDKNNRLTWSPVAADISASGDLGYTYGTFEFRSKDKEGKETVNHGKYMSVWKKQADGSWKVAVDMGNAAKRDQ